MDIVTGHVELSPNSPSSLCAIRCIGDGARLGPSSQREGEQSLDAKCPSIMSKMSQAFGHAANSSCCDQMIEGTEMCLALSVGAEA
jgi:hypothetical protein